MPPSSQSSVSSPPCNPCCRLVSLQTGTKIVAVLDVLLCFTITVFGASFCYHYLHPGSTIKFPESKDFLDSVEYVVMNGIGFMAVGILGIIFGIILYKGAQKDSERQVHMCLIFRYLLLVWDLIFFIREIMDAVGGIQIILALAELIFELYTLLVVYAYLQELRGQTILHFC